jgi:3-phenylpropionate/cinnamic acid dioxygenase small subunit
MSNAKIVKALTEDVVIFENSEQARTGAQAIAPDHSPRRAHRAGALPANSAIASSDPLQREVEQFLFNQAELLDGKHWQAFIDLFADDGIYWAPVSREQTEWLDSPSIFAEDRDLMRVRMGRITHPNAWSQAPMWEMTHVVGNVVVESASATLVQARSRFQLMELRRDAVRMLGGSYRHTLKRTPDGFRIQLQRVDLINAQAPWDYVIQGWV